MRSAAARVLSDEASISPRWLFAVLVTAVPVLRSRLSNSQHSAEIPKLDHEPRLMPSGPLVSMSEPNPVLRPGDTEKTTSLLLPDCCVADASFSPSCGETLVRGPL